MVVNQKLFYKHGLVDLSSIFISAVDLVTRSIRRSLEYPAIEDGCAAFNATN